MSAPTPSSQTPIVDDVGRPTPVWMRFFASLGGGANPGAASAVAGSSPLTFQAPGAGTLAVEGGTIIALSMSRGRTTLPLPAASALIPLGKGDTVTVAYSAAPTVTFLPA